MTAVKTTTNGPTSSKPAAHIPLLETPGPAVARHPGTLTHPKELQQWLDGVALADPALLADKLLGHLRLVVRDPEPGARHADLLQAFHEPLHMLQEKVWENFNNSRAMRKGERVLLQRVGRLLQEMAYPFMQRINQRISQSQSPNASDLFNAMLLMSRMIHWEVLQYHLTPPDAWRQMLLLFAISEYHRLSPIKCASALALDIDSNTVHTQFHATLTLLLADTYRLPYPALPRLVRGITQIAGLLRIGSPGKGRFNVPLSFSGRMPPMRFARHPGHWDQISKVLVLDELLNHLEQQPFPGDQPGGIQLGPWLAASLRGLTELGESSDARSQARHTRVASYRLWTGLDAVHRRVRELHGEQYMGTTVSDSILVEEETLVIPPAGHHSSQQIDQSLSGARLRLPSGVPVPQIGQLVLFEAEKPRSWELGDLFAAQVRRHLRRDDGSYDIGVEKLHGNLIPVSIGYQDSPGLLIDSQQDQLALFTQPGSFTPELRVDLRGPNENYRVKYITLLEDLVVQRIQVSLD